MTAIAAAEKRPQSCRDAQTRNDARAPRPSARRYCIRSYGCAMNAYDAVRMGDLLRKTGYLPSPNADEADLIILNTCHIREKATEKIYSELGRLRPLKSRKNRPPPRFAVVGCVAQAEGVNVARRNRDVDLIIGPQSYHRLPELLRRLDAGEEGPIVAVDFTAEEKFARLDDAPTPRAPVNAFLSIQEGCDKFCSFCVVPYTRGAEFSRPIEAIESEARRLVAGGARALTLLGQNVSAWNGRDRRQNRLGMADLLRRLSPIPDLRRLSYATSHPADIDADLIAAHRDLDILSPYLHLPAQSGSDRILKRMNRRYRADDYRRIIENLRKARPDLALSSDFIVGHPGETDDDFNATLKLVEDIGFAQSYSFRYSPRPGTPAAEDDDIVPDAVAKARLQRLQGVLQKQKLAFNQGFVGAVMPILFTGPGRRPGQSIGRSPYLQPVCVDAEIAPGTLAQMRISSLGAHALHGKPIDAPLSS